MEGSIEIALFQDLGRSSSCLLGRELDTLINVSAPFHRSALRLPSYVACLARLVYLPLHFPPASYIKVQEIVVVAFVASFKKNDNIANLRERRPQTVSDSSPQRKAHRIKTVSGTYQFVRFVHRICVREHNLGVIPLPFNRVLTRDADICK